VDGDGSRGAHGSDLAADAARLSAALIVAV
jgi:hypothetical protein